MRSLAHLRLAWNTPLSVSHADRLLASLDLPGGSQFTDLGCGWGGLLLRALAGAPLAKGIGVDLNRTYLDRARSSARRLGVSDRVRFISGDIVRFPDAGDRVICIGADHAWGGAEQALTGLSRLVDTGGRLLFGCGYWDRPAAPELIDMLGTLPTSFERVLASARSSNWKVRFSDSADLTEWDRFESMWRHDLEDIGAKEPDSPLGRQALRLSVQRRNEYERGYRGVLGFAYLILERTEESGKDGTQTL